METTITKSIQRVQYFISLPDRHWVQQCIIHFIYNFVYKQ